MNFALIGAAGYIAPRHMKAIRDTGNDLVVAYDRNDSVGIIDSYFPGAEFFTSFEEFALFTDRCRKTVKAIDYMAIASPNYLHHPHMNFALRNNAHVICEKPLVLDLSHIDHLAEVEKETGKRVYTILQLRHHPALQKVKAEVEASNKTDYDVDLTYITSRGKWYLKSWKSDESKSGGIASNIGIHFYDMLVWIFGAVKKNEVHLSTPTKAGGYLELERARVRWFLSLDSNDVPLALREKGQKTFRSIQVAGKEIEFSEGFTDLHTVSYQAILSGQGFGLNDARGSIEMVQGIRNSPVVKNTEKAHPFVLKEISGKV